MSRRQRAPSSVKFGSDSFLDVVANIVGILIILIVIAGLRISKTPVVLPLDDDDSPVDISQLDLTVPTVQPLSEFTSKPSEPEAEPEKKDLVVAKPKKKPVAKPIEIELPPLPPLEVPRELVEIAEKLEHDIKSIKNQEDVLAERLQETTDLQAALQERQEAIRKLIEEKEQAIDESNAKAAAIAKDVVLARETLARLKKQVEELESEPENVETLEHKITPISRVVNGHEKHYRLEKNRVAEVPLEELIGRFRDQIERRKDWLAKTRQHQGQIGPVRGFNLNYVVRVDTMSELDMARSGYGGYKISLGQWEITPEPDLKGETGDAALRKGSQFYQSLLGTASDTTLTFWVYPDSFELYRKLQKFTHDHGYSVAARPLPPGVPIAGSPNGSKSASQ